MVVSYQFQPDKPHTYKSIITSVCFFFYCLQLALLMALWLISLSLVTATTYITLILRIHLMTKLVEYPKSKPSKSVHHNTTKAIKKQYISHSREMQDAFLLCGKRSFKEWKYKQFSWKYFKFATTDTRASKKNLPYKSKFPNRSYYQPVLQFNSSNNNGQWSPNNNNNNQVLFH